MASSYCYGCSTSQCTSLSHLYSARVEGNGLWREQGGLLLSEDGIGGLLGFPERKCLSRAFALNSQML